MHLIRQRMIICILGIWEYILNTFFITYLRYGCKILWKPCEDIEFWKCACLGRKLIKNCISFY